MADRNWDEAVVTNATAANTIDTEINNVRIDVRERMAVDHDWDSSDTGASDLGTIGQHEQITFKAPRATPDLDADQGMVYTKDANSKAELHFCDEDDQEVQITTAGKLNLSGNIPADAIDEDDIRLTNNSYLTGRNAADDGDINIVKVNASDEVELGEDGTTIAKLADASKLASSAAPTEDEEIANKKYVDDNVGAANYTPTSGGYTVDSVTLPNGLIMKFGSVARTGDWNSVAFNEAFTTVLSVTTSCHIPASTTDDRATHIRNLTTSGFDVWSEVTSAVIYWMAIGV